MVNKNEILSECINFISDKERKNIQNLINNMSKEELINNKKNIELLCRKASKFNTIYQNIVSNEFIRIIDNHEENELLNNLEFKNIYDESIKLLLEIKESISDQECKNKINKLCKIKEDLRIYYESYFFSRGVLFMLLKKEG